MKRCVVLFLLLSLSASVMGQDAGKSMKKVVFMPMWIEQSQFAGYYMAKEHGFYEAEGLDVEIRHLPTNATTSVFEMLISGKADIVCDHLATGMRLRSKGYPVVNVLQTSQNSSLLCVTRHPLDSIGQLRGMKVARWKSLFGEGFDLLKLKYGINPVEIPYIRDVNLFVFGAVDAILVTSFNEYVALLESVGKIDPGCVISIAEHGFNYPEEGLFVSSEYYRHDKETVRKFVRASMRGWEYVREHKEEAVEYSVKLRTGKKLFATRYSEKVMLDKVLELQINPRTGKADFEPVNHEEFYRFSDELKKAGKLTNPVKYPDFIKDVRINRQ